MSIFLETLQEHRASGNKITIYLKSGIQLNGVISSVDESAVVLSSHEKAPSCISLEAIATFKNWEPNDNTRVNPKR
jgi:RNA chaperone Hfq